MARSKGECFLCQDIAKGAKVTFYSGVRKGGSKTELLSATVTVFERWNDLRMYDILVCKACQQELWKKHTFWPPVALAVGAGIAVLLGLICLLLPSPLCWILIGLFVFFALAAGGGAAVTFAQYAGQPPREQLEHLIVRAAMDELPDEGHTFITTSQYLELVERGIIG